MRKLKWCCVTLAVAFGCVCGAKAANVVWPVVWIEHGGSIGDYAMGTRTLSGAGAWIEMNLVYSGGATATLMALGGTAGLGHIWFQTDAGAPINAAAVSSAVPFARMQGGVVEMGSVTLTRFVPIYMAFFIDGDPLHEATYGWASLVWNGTALRLTDSAYETTGVGIYAGTYTAIPEPSAEGLIAAGLSALALRRKRR